MTNTENTIAVFTAKNLDSILAEGGSGVWKLDPARARKCTYVVCTQNAHNAEAYADATEPHGSAFLVGKISRIIPVDDRWRIEFSEYAAINQPEVWGGGHRNPVRYTTLDDLGVELDGVKWLPAPKKEGRRNTSAGDNCTTRTHHPGGKKMVSRKPTESTSRPSKL